MINPNETDPIRYARSAAIKAVALMGTPHDSVAHYDSRTLSGLAHQWQKHSLEPRADLVLLRVDRLHADVHTLGDLLRFQALFEVELNELLIFLL